MRLAVPATISIALIVAGCSMLDGTGSTSVKGIAVYATSFKHNVGDDRNFIDRALSECSEGTPRAETMCVKDALNAPQISLRSLTEAVPGCKIGLKCHYEHTTKRKVGFVEATSTLVIKHWSVQFDLSEPVRDASLVPVTVTDQDRFIVSGQGESEEMPKRMCTPHGKGPFACH